MGKYKIEIKLLSDTLVGSAEGHGAIIDSDIVFDEVGIPYIPARRVKGLLKDSATELNEMFSGSGINININVTELFGEKGNTTGKQVFHLSNLYIFEYEKNKDWLDYFIQSKSGISREFITKNFCNLRRQTSINEKTGTAKTGSLRTSRVLNKNIAFWGEIEIDSNYEKWLGIIAENTRKMGTKRNRGLGKIQVLIYDMNNMSLNVNGLKLLEAAL